MTNASDNNQSPGSDDRPIEPHKRQVRDDDDATLSLEASTGDSALPPSPIPPFIGRYRIVGKLGKAVEYQAMLRNSE